HSIGKLRWSYTTAPAASRQSMPPDVRAALAVSPDKRNAAQQAIITSHYRTVAPLLEPVRQEVIALEQKKQQLLDSLPKCLVTTAGAPRIVRVLPRGNWLDSTGPIVSPVVPASLGGLAKLDPAGRRPTRLDLARWITSRDN